MYTEIRLHFYVLFKTKTGMENLRLHFYVLFERNGAFTLMIIKDSESLVTVIIKLNLWTENKSLHFIVFFKGKKKKNNTFQDKHCNLLNY